MNVFDIIGPIMIGPSSSHTAGAVKLGNIAVAILGENAVNAHITLYGSFAKTYKGHGTDKALIAGIMGMLPQDEKIRFAPTLAEENGLIVTFEISDDSEDHPNTAKILLNSANNKEIAIKGASVGGGNILVTEINGLPVKISGQYNTFVVLHKDTPGTIADVTDLLASLGFNICNFRLFRIEKGGDAIMTIEIDGAINSAINEEIQALPNIISSTLLELT